jgi:hypothetical protein
MPLLCILQMADKVHDSAPTGEYMSRNVIFTKGLARLCQGLEPCDRSHRVLVQAVDQDRLNLTTQFESQ